MQTVNSKDLAGLLDFRNTDFTRKCRIYCNNIDVDLDQYHNRQGNANTYDLPIKLAIGIVENVRMYKTNRAKVLQDLYDLLGTPLVTQLPQRKETIFVETLIQVLAELDIEVIPQYPVGAFCLDAYIPEFNVMIEFDEYEHKYNKEQDELREFQIKLSLPHGLQVVRIEEGMPIGTALGKVLAALR